MFHKLDKDDKAGVIFAVEDCSNKKRKLNYIIHNPNTVEETAQVLLHVFVQANAGKVERKLRELSSCNGEIGELEGTQTEVSGII